MLELYAHPFSSYCQKVLIALYEREVPFTFRMLDGDHPENFRALKAYWPLGKFPVLTDAGRPVIESSIIIEYLDDDRFGATGKLLPIDRESALAVRFMDRVFDNHVMTPVQGIVNEYLIDPAAPDSSRIDKAKSALEAAYDWLEGRIGEEGWAAGDDFSLADCAAAPALFYADWVHPIGIGWPWLAAYRGRLLDRPSVARAVNEARPYRPLFPLGAPERD